MDNEYKDLLKQSINVEVALQKNLEALQENTKKLNENFVSHCATIGEIKTEVTNVRTEILKILRISIVALIVILGSLAGVKEVVKLFN